LARRVRLFRGQRALKARARGGARAGRSRPGYGGVLLLVVMLVLVTVLAGCGVNEPREPGSASQEPQDIKASSEEDKSDVSEDGKDVIQPLPRQRVTFTVLLPAELPTGVQLQLAPLTFLEYGPGQEEPIAMERVGPRRWQLTLELVSGSLFRYRYGRSDLDPWEKREDGWERRGDGRHVVQRVLYVDPQLTEVTETIAGWPGQVTAALGNLTGRVVDSQTGAPIAEATVYAGGMGVETRYDGSFTLYRLPLGQHQVTVVVPDGSYHYATASAELQTGEEGSLDFSLQPAAEVPVTFLVEVPADTPPENRVTILGSVPQLEARYYRPEPVWSGFLDIPSGIAQPVLEKVDDTHWRLTTTLHQGMYVEYLYMSGGNEEWAPPSPEGPDIWAPNRRALLVPRTAKGPITFKDRVMAWHTPHMVKVTFEVRVPVNTPATDVVHLSLANPWLPMTRVEPGLWRLSYWFSPGEEIRYGYGRGGLYGAGINAWEVTPSGVREETARRLVIPDGDSIQQDTVARWATLPPAPAEVTTGDEARVDFWLTVPYTTPEGPVFINIDGQRHPMEQINDTSWRLSIRALTGQTMEYSFQLADGPPIEGRRVEVKFDGQQVYEAVVAWPGSSPPTVSVPSKAQESMRMLYLLDFWNAEFLPNLATTLDRARDMGANWLVVSPVWNYESLNPPVISSRNWLNSTEDDLRQLVEMGRERGINIALVLQLHMMPEGERFPPSPREGQWWQAWKREYQAMVLYYAEVAQRTGVGMMNVDLWAGRDQEDDEVYNEIISETIPLIRERYDGLLTSYSASKSLKDVLNLDFHGKLDVITLHYPSWAKWASGPGATLAELKGMWDDRMKLVEDIYRKYAVPITIMAATGPPVKGVTWQTEIRERPELDELDDLELDFQEQADMVESFFQWASEEEGVAGLSIWAFNLIDQPYRKRMPGPRGRPVEKVIEKWFGAYAAAR